MKKTRKKNAFKKIKDIHARNDYTPPLSGPQYSDEDRAHAEIEILEEERNAYKPGYWGQKALNEAERVGETYQKPVANSIEEPSAVDLVLNWANGKGPSHYNFDSNSQHTKNMQDAWRVNEARNYYYKNKNPHSSDPIERNYTNVKGSFGLPDLFRAGIDPTEQFVGSYRIDIN